MRISRRPGAVLLSVLLTGVSAGASGQAVPPPAIRAPSAAETQALAAGQAALAAAMAKRDWAAAAAALERTVAIDAASWGPEHQTTILALETWAFAVQLSGDGVKAEALFRRALAVRLKTVGERHPQVATIDNGIGQALDTQGRFAEAEPYYRKAMDLRVALFGADSKEAGLAYNNLAANLGRNGKIAEAEALFRKSLAISAATEGAESEAVAGSLANLGTILSSAGRYKDAEVEHRKALAMRITLFGPDHQDVASSYNAIGFALTQQGRYAEAEPMLRKGLDIRRKTLGERSILTAESIGNLGSLLQSRGRASEAEPLIRQALAIWQAVAGPDHPNTLVIENNLATCLVDEARYAEAKPILRRVYDVRRRVLGDKHPETGVGANNLAGLLETIGREVEAEALYRTALAINRAALGEAHDATGTSYNNLAHNLGLQGRFVEAETLHRKALDIRRKALGEDHPDTADSYSNVGFALDGQRKFEEARPFYETALAINRKLYGDDSLRTAAAMNNLASNLDTREKMAEAAPLYSQAYEIRRKALGDDHPLTALSLNNVAYSLYVRGRQAEAIPLYRRATAAFRKTLGDRNPGLVTPLGNLAMVLVETPAGGEEALKLAREATGIAGQRRAAILAGSAAGGDGAAQAALRARGASALADDPAVTSYIALTQIDWVVAGRDKAAADGLQAEAFVAAQEINVSKAGQAMARTAARAAAGTGALGRLVSRQQALADQVSALEAAYIDANARGDRTAADRATAESAKAAAELAAADAAIARQFPDYSTLIAPRTVTIAEVQKRLAPDEGLLFIQPSNGDMFSFAVTRDRVAWHRAPKRQIPMGKEVEILICEVDPDGCDYTKIPPPGPETPFQDDGYARFDRATAYALYRDLVAPVEGALAGTKRLYVTTTGSLARLPLGLLVTAPPPAGDDADPAIQAATPWLADRYALTVLPAVSTLHALKRTRPTGGQTAFRGYGAPHFNGSDGNGDVAGAARGLRAPARAVFGGASANGSALADPAALRDLLPLPGTRVELMAMASALKAPASALRLDIAATEAALRRDPGIAGARVIAFATHGLLPDDIRGLDEPGLVFTPPAIASADDDGVLTASEAAGLTLSADWVILSACNTAAAEAGAESLSGLSRAFLFAGAGALLASHWRVSDEATAILTVETLSDSARMTRAAALQAAMRGVRNGKRADGSVVAGWKPEWAHPAFWSPFSVIADHDD